MSNPVEIVAKALPGLGEFDTHAREQAALALIAALEREGARVMWREDVIAMVRNALQFTTMEEGIKAEFDVAPRYGEPNG